MKYVVAQLGARMHYAVPRILADRGCLSMLYTDIAAVGAVRTAAGLLSATGVSGIRRLRGRRPSGIPEGLVRQFPGFGLIYRLRALHAATEEDKTAVSLWAGREFCRRVVQCGFSDARAAYAFSSMAEGVLKAARERGLYGVLEQINAPRRVYDRYYREEHAAWPGWEAYARRSEVLEEFIAREENEWRLAERIVCGSQFVLDGIREDSVPMSKCSVVPYGVSLPAATVREARDGNGLNVLFSGRVSLIKGIPYLVGALRRLQGSGVRCRIAGRVFLTGKAERELKDVAEVLGVVPRSRMQELYNWADVFVLPTLCEGSATVCYEALASGLPVITTPNAGSVVRDGIDGLIVPIRDSDKLATAIELLVQDRLLRDQMSHDARQRASEFTLAEYSNRLSIALGVVSDNFAVSA